MTKQVKILLVNDDDPNRQLIVYLMSKEGCEVVECRNETEVAPGCTGDCDIIILDLKTKDREIDFVKNVKCNPETTHVPIIVQSNRDTPDDIIMALELGADDYIVRPTPFPHLYARMRAVLRRRHR